MKLYDRIFPPRVLELSNGKQVLKYRSRAPLGVLAVVLLTALSVKVTGFDMGILAARIREFFVILGEMFPPDWGYLSQVWQPLFDTIKMSLLGSVIGSLLVVPFAMLASTNIIRSRLVVSAVRLLLSIIRTLPTLVTALIATYIFGLGTLAGTTAIAIFTFAYIGKILYEEIETVDMGAFEAMEAMGATKARINVVEAPTFRKSHTPVYRSRDAMSMVENTCASERRISAELIIRTAVSLEKPASRNCSSRSITSSLSRPLPPLPL